MKYQVSVTTMDSTMVEVDADSAELAENIVEEMLVNGEVVFDGFNGEITVDYVEKIEEEQ